MELHHSSHKHPLMLCENGKYDSDILCYGCNLRLSGDAYKCGECEFIIHESCTNLPDKIIHILHPKHPLTLFAKSPYDIDGAPRCSNCEEEIWGFSYHCSICEYDLDLKCVFLREVVNHEGHKHSFTLFRPTKFTCDACGEPGNDFSYVCTVCQLMLHKACGLVSPQTPLSADKFIPAKQTLGEDKASSSLLTKGVEDISLDEKCKLTEMEYFSHGHPLTLNDDDPLDEEICDACTKPLSAPFYACAPCEYFLHFTCAQLPITIQNAHHPHRLKLIKRIETYQGLFICTVCERIGGGFAYVCELCNYVIDINCGLVLKTNRLTSAGHEHVLNLVQKIHRTSCDGCGQSIALIFRYCNDCDFNICMECSALPPSARHRWDEKHLLKLTTVNIEHASGIYFCDFCEEDRDPKHWYYSCKECDLSFHPRCLFGRHNIKYGKKIQSPWHPDHGVYFMERMKDHLRCKTWCQLEKTDLFVYECRTCDYHCHLGYDFDFQTRRVDLVPTKNAMLK